MNSTEQMGIVTMESTVVRKMLRAMVSTSPSTSRHIIEPLTDTGMDIWATATPAMSASALS